MIRIGSLREINRALGLAEEDTQTIKKALLQNASAFISAKIRFKPKNARGGRENTGARYTTPGIPLSLMVSRCPTVVSPMPFISYSTHRIERC
jgi:hypothetical protein